MPSHSIQNIPVEAGVHRETRGCWCEQYEDVCRPSLVPCIGRYYDNDTLLLSSQSCRPGDDKDLEFRVH